MRDQSNILEFYGLGFETIIGISAEHKTNFGDMLDLVSSKFTDNTNEVIEEGLKIAVLGRPNAGKSSFVNKILNKDRSIVSDIAGTTRDSIDSQFRYNSKPYTIIDTAGIRKIKTRRQYRVLQCSKSCKSY